MHTLRWRQPPTLLCQTGSAATLQTPSPETGQVLYLRKIISIQSVRMLSPTGMFTSAVKSFMTLHLSSTVQLVKIPKYSYISAQSVMLRLSNHNPHCSYRLDSKLGQHCELWLCCDLHLLFNRTETLLHSKNLQSSHWVNIENLY